MPVRGILYATYEQYDELYRFCLVCSSPDPSSTKVTIKYGSIVKQFTVKVEDPISTTVSEVAKITSNLPFTTNDNFYLTEQWYTMTGYVKEYYELNGQCSFYFYDTDINETIWVFYPLCEQAISTGMNVRVSGQLYRYEYDTTTIYYGLCEGRAEAITPEVDYDYSLVVTGVPSSYTLLVWEWNNGFEGNWLDMIKMDDNAYCVNLTKDNYLIAVFDSSYTAATASWDYCLSQTSDYVRNVTQAVFQFSILFPALS